MMYEWKMIQVLTNGAGQQAIIRPYAIQWRLAGSLPKRLNSKPCHIHHFMIHHRAFRRVKRHSESYPLVHYPMSVSSVFWILFRIVFSDNIKRKLFNWWYKYRRVRAVIKQRIVNKLKWSDSINFLRRINLSTWIQI